MIYLFNMNYDQYKLSNPFDEGRDSDLVTSCCGSEEEVKESLAHDDKIYYCSECGNTSWDYDLIEQYEYDEKMKDHFSELDNEDY